MTARKNYIEIYYGMITNGEVVVSEKVRKLYKHLTAKLQDAAGRYVFDQAKADMS